jgi:Uncharacterized conserved protein
MSLQPIGGGSPTPPPPPAPAPAPVLTPSAPVAAPAYGPPPQNPWAMSLPPTAAEKFGQDKFLMNQKLFSLNSKYHMYDQFQQPLFFIDRPLLKLKTQIGVYEDEAKSRKVLSVNVESFWSIINLTFLVNDADGNTVGYLRRKGWLSMLRRTWHIEDNMGRTIAVAQEDSWWKAILRRVLASVDLEIISAMIRTNFILTRPGSTEVFGEFIRRFTIGDKYVLDLTRDPQRSFDRRLAVGLAIVLDNAERR